MAAGRIECTRTSLVFTRSVRADLPSAVVMSISRLRFPRPSDGQPGSRRRGYRPASRSGRRPRRSRRGTARHGHCIRYRQARRPADLLTAAPTVHHLPPPALCLARTIEPGENVCKGDFQTVPRQRCSESPLSKRTAMTTPTVGAPAALTTRPSAGMLMDAAMKVMARNGYAAMSVGDVLSESGLSTPPSTGTSTRGRPCCRHSSDVTPSRWGRRSNGRWPRRPIRSPPSTRGSSGIWTSSSNRSGPPAPPCSRRPH